MKKNILLFFSIILIVFCMIILSGYEKVKMAGIFGKDIDDKTYCEVYEDEDDFYRRENMDNPQNENYHQKPEQDKAQDEPQLKTPDNKKHKSPKDNIYKRKKRHRFFDPKFQISESFFDILHNQLHTPFKFIRPGLKRDPKSSEEKRRTPPKPCAYYSKENAQSRLSLSGQAQKKGVTLQTIFGNVVQKDAVNKIIVKGDSVSGQYYDNIIIEIYDVNDTLINTIRPKTNSGYGANIMLGDFAGNGLKQIFLGINSGGSGGFGYFYVFDAQNNEIKTLFDYQDFSQKNQYIGEYLNNYKAKVSKKGSKEHYIIDLSSRSKDYLDMIWKSDGQLIAPRKIDISDVNTVFSYYNYATQLYELIIYQRVTGLFNADSLGYVITQQHLKDGKFIAFFEGLMIFPQ